VKLLLDTHVFLWLNAEPEMLSITARVACEDPGNSLYLSLASIWEIQIKQQLGKLRLDSPWQQMISTQRQENNLVLLSIELPHIETLENLPSAHRDPFDRLIIAQALHEEMTVISADSIFNHYPIPIIS
jgi:PIN domain nuclease of toxin-antitoxin system